jgi:hypothetical protein
VAVNRLRETSNAVTVVLVTPTSTSHRPPVDDANSDAIGSVAEPAPVVRYAAP